VTLDFEKLDSIMKLKPLRAQRAAVARLDRSDGVGFVAIWVCDGYCGAGLTFAPGDVIRESRSTGLQCLPFARQEWQRSDARWYIWEKRRVRGELRGIQPR